jgi:hypothetical protein
MTEPLGTDPLAELRERVNARHDQEQSDIRYAWILGGILVAMLTIGILIGMNLTGSVR